MSKPLFNQVIQSSDPKQLMNNLSDLVICLQSISQQIEDEYNSIDEEIDISNVPGFSFMKKRPSEAELELEKLRKEHELYKERADDEIKNATNRQEQLKEYMEKEDIMQQTIDAEAVRIVQVQN